MINKYMEYQLNEYDKKMIADADEYLKSDIGSVDIEMMISEISEKLIDVNLVN